MSGSSFEELVRFEKVGNIEVKVSKFKNSFGIAHLDGVTRDSLKVFSGVRKRYSDFVKAQVSPGDFGDLLLEDSKGNLLRLSGCTAGYGGEGPHGTITVLKEAGFKFDENLVKGCGNKGFKLVK